MGVPRTPRALEAAMSTTAGNKCGQPTGRTLREQEHAFRVDGALFIVGNGENAYR